MSVKIGSNITSLNVQRNLGDATAQLSKSMERLSSGLRINRASDDAAGLAISETLKSSSRVYSTAIRNVNDGLSYLNITDGALAELSNITSRHLELAEQAANGTYSRVQRQALDAEADALVKEFNRIVKTTEFNGTKVLDVEDSSGLVRIQAGYGVTGSLGISVGAELSRFVGTGTFGKALQYSTDDGQSRAIVMADVDGDGDLDMVTAGYGSSGGTATVKKNNGDGTFGVGVSYSTEGDKSLALVLADIDGDGDKDLITAGYGSSGGKVTVRKNNGSGSFGAAVQYSMEATGSSALSLADIDNDGDLDMISAGQNNTTGSVSVRKNDGSGSFGAVVQYTSEGTQSFGVTLADIDGDGDLDLVSSGYDNKSGKVTIRLNNGSGVFGTAAQYTSEQYDSRAISMTDIDGDGDLDMISVGNQLGQNVSVRMNNGDGTFGAVKQYTTNSYVGLAISMSDVDGDGDPDMLIAGQADQGIVSLLKNNGDGTFASPISYTTEDALSFGISASDIDKDGVLDMLTGGTGPGGQVTIRKGIGHKVATIAALNLCTQSNARDAITTLKAQLDRISAERGNIGSAQSRLSVALNTLSTTRENFDAASSRITDVDVAQEAADMTRNQIAQQVGASILASANQAPEIALKLLK